MGTGAQNTIDIVTKFGDYANKGDYAAKFCSDLKSGGYDDWFLPSKDELGAIWDNLVDDGSGRNSGVGGFASGIHYWSSSEYKDSTASSYYQSFYNGTQGAWKKNVDKRIRAIRAF